MAEELCQDRFGRSLGQFTGEGGRLKIEKVSIYDLSQDPANVRKHGERNIDSIMASLRAFGQQKPIVIDSRGIILAGNGTFEAAKRLGWLEIDAVKSELEGTNATAYAIADNRTAELAEWDETALAEQLRALQSEEFDLSAVGFDDAEVDQMLNKLAGEMAGEITEDDVPEPPADPITKPGDVWILGEHRLLCGDSTKAEDVARLMDGAKADLCFTSPPYGQQRDYTKEGKEKCQDWDGLMRGVFANLPMTDAGQVLVNLGMIHRDGEWIPYWDGWIEWMREQGWKRFGWYVWDKKHPMPMRDGGRLLPQHEWIFHFNNEPRGCHKTIASATAGTRHDCGARNAKGIQGDEGVFLTGSHRVLASVVSVAPEDGRMNGNPHPAQFPVALPSMFIPVWTDHGQFVYEPFCGSGTTLIAAEQLGRRCYGMEISPAYCDVIVKRWEQATGQVAVREFHRRNTGDAT